MHEYLRALDFSGVRNATYKKILRHLGLEVAVHKNHDGKRIYIVQPMTATSHI